jgi:ketosteroid isomerase-like protein
MVSNDPNTEVALEMLASFTSKDSEGFMRHISDDFVYESPFYSSVSPVHGRHAMRSILQAVATIFATVRFDVIDAFVGSEPGRVVVECRGDSVVASTGASYRNHYVMLLRFRDDKVISWREFSNPDIYRNALSR